MQVDWKNLPADQGSVETVATNGLEYRVVDTSDSAVFDPYLQAAMRGFLSQEYTAEQLGAVRDAIGFRRFAGVYDAAAFDASAPVGTVNSWVAELTLPGGTGIPMWAISGVTVAPTHRRKGIARAMLEGELRTATAAGTPIAGLTVSEATIYGRFGFAPAAFAADWTIETKRAVWIGPRPQGRVDFVDREHARDELAALHERVRPSHPGEIEAWPGLWRRMTGTAAGQEDGRKHRVVRFSDAAGVTRGMAVYRISDEGDDFTKHQFDLHYLLSETPDAYAALWRFVLEHDLVSVVKAHLRSVDEPLRWMIADQRGAKVETSEHHWVRILDVPATLSARRYRAAGSVTLRVIDPLGFADGTWRLAVDVRGAADVLATDAAADVSLPVNALSSLLLGGVRAFTLRDAGLVECDEAVAVALDAMFASASTPHLSLWY